MVSNDQFWPDGLLTSANYDRNAKFWTILVWRHSDVIITPKLSQPFGKGLFYQYLTSVQIWSHLDHFWGNGTIFWVLHFVWDFLYIRYLALTKLPRLPLWAWKWSKILRKHAKLNYMHIKISVGLRPTPIFHFLDICARGVILPPPQQK